MYSFESAKRFSRADAREPQSKNRRGEWKGRRTMQVMTGNAEATLFAYIKLFLSRRFHDAVSSQNLHGRSRTGYR